MNRTQFLRTCGLVAAIVALMGYTAFAVDLSAEDTATGTPDTTPEIAFSCAAPASPSPDTTPTGAQLEGTGLSRDSLSDDDTVISGTWRLPAGTSLRIDDGTRAWVQVEDGAVALEPCGGAGIVDTEQGDGQATQLMGGASSTVTSPTGVLLFLDESAGSFLITAAADEDAVVRIDVLGATTDTVVCDEQQCWGMSDATPTAEALASPEAGCYLVRCWTK